jgi:PhnB protein
VAINIYLNFNGNCREAVQYYADVFGLDKPELMTFGDQPPNPEYPLPEEAKDLIMHARLNIQGSIVMFSDTFPGMPFAQGSNNFSLAVVSSDTEQLQAIFHKLKEGGSVQMELQETFWSKSYGSLQDKFGINWQVSHEDPQASA